MALEGTVQNGVVVLDPGGPPLANGTRVEVAPRTGMEPLIRKTPGLCGGRACVGSRRIAVWMLVLSRDLGASDEQLLSNYTPPLTPAELDAAWRYYREHPLEIERDIWWNDTVENGRQDGSVPAVVVEGKLLGLSDAEVGEAFEPPLSAEQVVAAWTEYHRNPTPFARRPLPTHQAG